MKKFRSIFIAVLTLITLCINVFADAIGPDIDEASKGNQLIVPAVIVVVAIIIALIAIRTIKKTNE